MLSPIDAKSNCIYIRSLRPSKIINLYHSFGIDVSSYFADTNEVKIFRCSKTGYMFYSPFNLSGNSDFYIHFQKFDWYYMPWKWEHDISLDLIETRSKVLEIGCAEGAFLKKLSEEKNVEATGLELNASTVGKKIGFEILESSIEEFAINRSEAFDVVCSFQVLEHISDIHSFIQAQLKCLKKDGLLIVSVPNNDSFVGMADYALNLPPHHMGLWTPHSLSKLTEVFGIKLIKVYYEPLQNYHYDSYLIAKLKAQFGNLAMRIIYKALRITRLRSAVYRYFSFKKNAIKGHTMLAVFKKI